MKAQVIPLAEFCESRGNEGAIASTTPPKSMRDMLGIRDPSSGKNGEEVQKQREKTAYDQSGELGWF